MIICFGTASGITTNNSIVNFPITFKSVRKVVVIRSWYGNTNQTIVGLNIGGQKLLTGFYVYSNNSNGTHNGEYIAVGY